MRNECLIKATGSKLIANLMLENLNKVDFTSLLSLLLPRLVSKNENTVARHARHTNDRVSKRVGLVSRAPSIISFCTSIGISNPENERYLIMTKICIELNRGFTLQDFI